MSKKKRKGILFIAKDRYAFQRFYERVKEEIFKPAALALPSKDELKERIQNALSEKAENTTKSGFTTNRIKVIPARIPGLGPWSSPPRACGPSHYPAGGSTI